MKVIIGTYPNWKKFWGDPTRMHEYRNCMVQFREPTPEEIEQLRIPLAIIEIIIPEQVYLSEPIQQLIGRFRTIYSGLDIRTYDGKTHIDNIDLADIKKFITKETYKQLKALGIIRPFQVVNLFEEKPLPANEDENDQTP